MRSQLDPGERDALQSSPLFRRLVLTLVKGFSLFSLILVTNALRVPSGLKNFWAEDGAIFYSDVLNKDFPKRLFIDSGGGGYLNLSGKIIAEFVGIFPIKFAPVINFISVNLVYAILVVVIYNRLHIFFNKRIFLFLFMGFFVFVPIASFDSLATSINLHFYLLFTSFVLIFSHAEKSTVVGHAIIFVTCLSDPLAILFLPAILASTILKKKVNSLLLTYGISSIIQLIFILQFFDESTRVVGLNPNIIKTSYLFMDRVVGSSLIPYWGFIDGQSLENNQIPSILILRLVLSFIVLSMVIYSSSIAGPLNLVPHKNGQNFLVASMLFTFSLYWSVAGVFFSPEPRYAIFPSLCLVLIFLMSLDSIVADRIIIRFERYIHFAISLMFISIFVSAFHASSIRSTNQIWSKQVEAGKDACRDSKLFEFEFIIPPQSNNLVISINCKMLRED